MGVRISIAVGLTSSRYRLSYLIPVEFRNWLPNKRMGTAICLRH